eukprot:15443464-Alexandrium_andersonii.AAC.1
MHHVATSCAALCCSALKREGRPELFMLLYIAHKGWHAALGYVAPRARCRDHRQDVSARHTHICTLGLGMGWSRGWMPGASGTGWIIALPARA